MSVRYSTFRICELRTSHVEPYRTSVPYFSLIFEAYRTRTITKKMYRTNVPYFIAKIEAYRTSILAFNYLQLWLTLKSLVYKSFTSTHTFSIGLAVFCICIQKAGAMCEKSGVFNSKSVLTYRTRTITKKSNVPTYRTSWKKLRRTVPYCHPCFKVNTTVAKYWNHKKMQTNKMLSKHLTSH